MTICAHDLEVQIDLVIPPGAEAQAERVTAALREAHPRALFAEDGEAVETIVLDLARERGLTIGTAESCTGGLVSARLTSVPGSSDVFAGGLVAYDDRVKLQALGLPSEVLERHGAVSAETASAMAAGARRMLGVDVAVSVTGVAGPGAGHRRSPSGSSSSTPRPRTPLTASSCACRATATQFGAGRPPRRSTCSGASWHRVGTKTRELAR